MNWGSLNDFFMNWGSFKKNGIQSSNRFQGSGFNNYPRNHNSKKASKAKKKNRSGGKRRKANRK